VRKLVVLLLVALAMAATNPSRDQFREHVQARVVEAARQAGQGGLVEAALAIKDVTNLDLVRMYADTLADGAELRNYGLFSLYTLKGEQGVQTYIGLFQRFIKVP
jgi:hypothetical protein